MTTTPSANAVAASRYAAETNAMKFEMPERPARRGKSSRRRTTRRRKTIR